MIDVGIVGVGTYLPEKTMKAAEIARLTNGVWSEDAVINKLGIKQRYLPGPDDGTQEMGAKAALKCLVIVAPARSASSTTTFLFCSPSSTSALP